MNFDTTKVTRFEVIDNTGRAYAHWSCGVEWSLQDDGRTLKVFVTKKFPPVEDVSQSLEVGM